MNGYQQTAYKIYKERDKSYRINKSLASAKTMRENGIYEENAKKHKIYQNEIMKSGLTRAQETGKKVSKTRKKRFESGELIKLTGADNPSASIINIYNENNELMFECNGNFKKVCEQNNLPLSTLKKSYRNNGHKILENRPRGMSLLYWNKYKHFSGWCATKIK